MPRRGTLRPRLLTGQSAAPADLAGFGLVDAADARDLAAAAFQGQDY